MMAETCLWRRLETLWKAASKSSLSEWVSEVTQSCPTLCDPMDCSLPHSSVHGIFQARILEWIAISFSRKSSRPRDGTQVSCTVGRRVFYETPNFLLQASEHSSWKRNTSLQCLGYFALLGSGHSATSLELRHDHSGTSVTSRRCSSYRPTYASWTMRLCCLKLYIQGN